MKCSIGRTLARLLAVLAIVFQAFLPGSLAVADSKGVDLSRFMCVPSGEMSPKARAAAEQIATLLGEDLPGEQPEGDHCPLCTLAQGVPPPEPPIIATPTVFPREQAFFRFELGLVRKAQGPPLGSRGPPFHI